MSLLSTVPAGQPRFSLHALAADHGDCIVLSYSLGDQDFRIVVDAGTQGTAERLRSLIERAPTATWELLVITHIDADHIGGALDLLADASIAGRFQDVWFNGRQHLDPPGTESLGVRQGLELQVLLADRGIPWNRAFGGRAACLPGDGAPINTTLASGAIVTLLTPSVRRLASLRTLWDRFVARQRPTTAAPVPVARTGLEIMGGSGLNVRALALSRTPNDNSVPNGSSIAFMVEFAGKRVLLGADAHSDVLVSSGQRMNAESRRIDVFKLPHHGSAKNVTTALLETYPADRFVVSTNGAHHDHPDDVAIARVVLRRPGAELGFNYPTAAYERWQRHLAGTEPQRVVRAGTCEDGVTVQLL